MLVSPASESGHELLGPTSGLLGTVSVNEASGALQFAFPDVSYAGECLRTTTYSSSRQ